MVKTKAISLLRLTFSLQNIIDSIIGTIIEYDKNLYHKDNGHNIYIFGIKYKKYTINIKQENRAYGDTFLI